MKLKKYLTISLTSCLVVIWFLPFYLIADIHEDLLLSKTNLDLYIIKYVTVAFIVMAIFGTMLGLIIWPMLGLYDFLSCILLIQILANMLLLAFSFIDTLYSYRIVIVLMFIGLTIGLSQVTITMFFANQYEDSTYYTLLNHFMLYALLHVALYVLLRLIMSYRNEFRSRSDVTLHNSYIWEVLLILVLNMITLGLFLYLGESASKEQGGNFNFEAIKHIDLNLLGSVVEFFWPLIFVVLCVPHLLSQFYDQCQSMDRGFSSSSSSHKIEYQCFYNDYTVQPIFALLCILLLKFVFLVGLDDTNRIKVGYCFIAISAILSLFLDFAIEDERFRYYNVPKQDATLRIFLNEGRNWDVILDPDNFFKINDIKLRFQQDIPLVNLSSIWAQYNQTNLTTYPPNLTYAVKERYYPTQNYTLILNILRGEETWNINYAINQSVGALSFRAMIYRRPSSLPLVFLFQNLPPKNASFISIANGTFIINTTNGYFHEMLEGVYDLNTSDGLWWGKYNLQRGGIYVILLYRPNETNQFFCPSNDYMQSFLTVIEPYSYHILWQLPQFLLLIVGIFMIVTSTLKISYNLPNSNIKCEAIAIFFCIINIGYLLYFVLVNVFYFDLFEEALIIPVTLLLAYAYIHWFVYIWDYLILPTKV